MAILTRKLDSDKRRCVKMEKRPDLLVLGASGGVANVFLQQLVYHRNFFDRLVLLDKDKKLLFDPYLDHKTLNYIFLFKEIELPRKKGEYLTILKKYRINIVLDLTDADSLPILEMTNKAGVSYINTSMNAEEKTVSDLIFDVYPKKEKLDNACHILCAGMNPGIVNMWVRYGIERFSLPKEVIHFEYDSSRIAKKWQPMITWSIKEFLVEAVRDPSGIILGRNEVKKILPNALLNKINMKPILQPIFKLKKYPYGFLILHEENITIAQKYNIPSKFIYAIDQKTMDYLIETYKRKKQIQETDLVVGDNAKYILKGSDNIGVLLEYDDIKVYYLNSLPNIAVIRKNATYTQVASGIFATLFTLLFDCLKPGVHFVEDLYDTHYRHYMFDNMRVQEFVFKKQKGGLKLISYVPEIKIKRRDEEFKSVYV